MRRIHGFLLVALLIAPALVPAGWPAGSGEAMRCAIVCGHASSPGASCCPLAAEDGRPRLKACPQSNPESLVPHLASTPALFVAMPGLRAPAAAGAVEADVRATLSAGRSHPLDHVPLSSS